MNRLKDLREDKDLYQKDIANLLKTTQNQYSRYETGIRYLPIYHLEKLADFYNTSTDYILGRTNIKEPYPKKNNMHWHVTIIKLQFSCMLNIRFVF